jgi:hypothetical protein
LAVLPFFAHCLLLLILFGDGTSGYGLAESDIVGSDAIWTQIAREQLKILKNDVGTVLGRSANHEGAAGYGAEGILVKTSRGYWRFCAGSRRREGRQCSSTHGSIERPSERDPIQCEVPTDFKKTNRQQGP